jgi:hypothetical protein
MAATLGKRSCVLGFNETKSALLVAITLPCEVRYLEELPPNRWTACAGRLGMTLEIAKTHTNGIFVLLVFVK